MGRTLPLGRQCLSEVHFPSTELKMDIIIQHRIPNAIEDMHVRPSNLGIPSFVLITNVGPLWNRVTSYRDADQYEGRQGLSRTVFTDLLLERSTPLQYRDLGLQES